MIFYNGIYYRGDTMNSWQTTLVEFFRCFGGGYNGYLKHLTINNRNKNKWRIPQQHPAKDWVDFRSDPENYKHPLESYIINFMDVVYTIGNFLPVPLVPRFNAKRASLTNDYWDLTLLAIYYHYIGEDKRNSDGWQDLFRYEGVRRWLGQYGEGEKK